jgi:hypothetical protein
VSDDDNNVLKEPAGDDADGGGVTSAEHITPNPIDSNLLGQAHPSVVNQVNATAPSAGGQKRKCPPPALKHKQLKPAVNQVMTQIELPSYRGPRSPLDLVAVEIIFGCLSTRISVCWCWNIDWGCCPACEENARAAPEERPCA